MDLQKYAVAHNVLAIAGMNIDEFCQIEAASEKQHDFALDLKCKALSTGWSAIQTNWQTPAFAKAMVAAFNQHHDARFWIDNQNKFDFPNNTMRLFNAEIRACLDAQEA